MQIYIYLFFFKRIVCVVLQSLFQILKNWLKRFSALTAYVWGAASCSTLSTADKNAVTESAVTTVSSSRFQSATVLKKNEFLYCSILLSGIFTPQEFRISCRNFSSRWLSLLKLSRLVIYLLL